MLFYSMDVNCVQTVRRTTRLIRQSMSAEQNIYLYISRPIYMTNAFYIPLIR